MNNTQIGLKEENYIFFSIGASNYAFKAKYVLDIMQLVELEYPESMPDYITGLLEYNNRIVKIIDIRNVMKIDAENFSLNSQIILIKTENDTFGIIVDSIKEIRQINTITLNSPPYTSKKSYIEAIYTDKDSSATIINIENIEAKINDHNEEIELSGKSSALFLPKDTSSKEILHRRRLHYAKKSRDVSYEIIKSQDTYISFILDKNTCCIKILRVSGFYKLANVKLTKVPCTPDFIMGIVSIKGRYITVIDLLKYTENRYVEITKDTSIIVVEYEDYEIGILADSIGETIDIEEAMVDGKNENDNVTLGCFRECVVNGSLYLFLDVKKLFEDEKLYVS